MRKLMICVLMLWLGLQAVTRAADAAEPPGPWRFDGIVEKSSVYALKLSPDGKHIAGLSPTPYGPNVFVIDVDTLTMKVIFSSRLGPPSGRDKGVPMSVNWIAADLLALDFSYRRSEAVDLTGKTIAVLGQRFIRRLNDEGQASDMVLAYRNLESGEIDLVNARTDEHKKFRVSLPGHPIHWAFDAAASLRAVTMMDTAFWSDETKVSNWYRPNEAAEWQLLEEFPVTSNYWIPIAVLAQADSLAVWSRHGRDTAAVFRYDARRREHAELMAGHPSEDIVRAVGLDRPEFQFVMTAGMKPTQHWFDARWASLQAVVDAALPGHFNRLSGNSRGRVLILSHADIDPGRWFLLDTPTMRMQEIAQFRPGVEQAEMRPMEIDEYLADDGLNIKAYLTRPLPTAALPPLVVLIHGGPNQRDEWGWNEEVQLLARHGYAVFQPQFRGSAGFGQRFEEAGFGQWGLAMQDDITAGVKHLIERKLVDPKRICIYGASYGGYAALWGVTKTPDLYQCAVSFAGVSDIGFMLTDSSDRNTDAVVREIQRARIGDLALNRQQFDQVSPVRQAARIRVPVLLAHGESDERVPISHSNKMRAALREHGKAHEWMLFERAGHGLWLREDRLRFYGALLTFLDKNIGAAAGPLAQASQASRAAPATSGDATPDSR